MYDEHRKGARVQYLGLQTDIEHDQFHQAEKWFRGTLMRQGKNAPFATHQGTDSSRLAPVETCGISHQAAGNELGGEGDEAD
jgi:hypothetical protein